MKTHQNVNIKVIKLEKVRYEGRLGISTSSMLTNEFKESNRLFNMDLRFVETSQITKCRGNVAMGDGFVQFVACGLPVAQRLFVKAKGLLKLAHLVISVADVGRD